MRHLRRGRKLKRTSSHKGAMMKNLVTSLFQHKKISTTEAKAKELRPFAEQLITKAKRAILKEKQGLLPEGQTIDIHSRRIVYKDVRNKAVLQELFDTIAPLVAERPGGYTRIVKTGTRRGDGSRTAIIELVDWSAPQDGAVDFKSKKKRRAKRADKIKVKKEKEVTESIEEETTEETEAAIQGDESTEAVDVVDVESVVEEVFEETEKVSEKASKEPDVQVEPPESKEESIEKTEESKN